MGLVFFSCSACVHQNGIPSIVRYYDKLNAHLKEILRWCTSVQILKMRNKSWKK